MNRFQHKLWGYELSYPDSWIYKKTQDIEAFAAYSDSLKPNYEGEKLGHVFVRGEFNPHLQPIESLWNQHIAKLSVILGAKRLGSAPLKIGGGTGFEVEIVLPKKDKKRLWVGILSFNATVLHLMVLHLKENRSWFEPLASKVVASIHFIKHAEGIETDSIGLPIPSEYKLTAPGKFLHDIKMLENWAAFDGEDEISALQNFYVRELPNYGWEIISFEPYPSTKDVNFARFIIRREGVTATLGILPFGDKYQTGKIVVKYEDKVKPENGGIVW
jgi:hypothetical protein